MGRKNYVPEVLNVHVNESKKKSTLFRKIFFPNSEKLTFEKENVILQYIFYFTPRDIKFRTILVRKTFSWQVWLHHSPSARAANSHSSENVSSHS